MLVPVRSSWNWWKMNLRQDSVRLEEGVFGSTDHAGGNGGSFSGIAEEFILAVIEFHGRLGGVASGAMHIHQQFAVMNREFRMFFIWEVVFKQPVAFGADYSIGPSVWVARHTASTEFIVGEPPMSPVP